MSGMAWYTALAFLFGLLITGLLAGIPVAIAFLVAGVVGSLVIIGGWQALTLIPTAMIGDIGSFGIAAVALFILMGTILYESGFANKALDGLDTWIGRVPGRMTYLAIAGATGFGAISGSAMASTATLGSSLAPEMQRRGYASSMVAGPIVGAGGLAMIIPPSNMAVILGSVAGISIGELLIAGLIPGVLIALAYVAFTAVRVRLNPRLVPPQEDHDVTVRDRLQSLKLILPVGFIFASVIGTILAGIATPTESAGAGVLASTIVVAASGMLDREVVRSIIGGTIRITANVLFIVAGASVFSRMVSLSGASRGLVNLVSGLDMPPTVVIALMLLTVIVLGMFMEQTAIVLVTAPVFIPIVQALGANPVWFGILVLICLEIGMQTPPFGLGIYVAQNFMPWISMRQMINAVFPYIVIDTAAVGVFLLIPGLVTWLPGLI